MRVNDFSLAWGGMKVANRTLLPAAGYDHGFSARLLIVASVKHPPDLTHAAFGARLRQLREARGLSQNSLAERVGVSQATISSWERGVGAPDVVELVRLAKALKMHPEVLIDAEQLDVDRLPRHVATEVLRCVRTIQQLIRPYRSSRQGKPSAERRAPAEP